MVQTLVPITTESAGNWTDQAGGTTNLHQTVDELVTSDTDYVKSEVNPNEDTIRFKLTAGVDPNTSSGYSVTYRVRSQGTGGTSLIVRLVQGASTLIATWNHELVSTSFTDITQTLTTSQTNAITDHTDLYLEFIAHETIPVQSWDYFVTFDGIRSQNLVQERAIDKLKLIDGNKLWPAYGEWDALGGSRSVYSVNLDTRAVVDEVGSALTTDHYTPYQTSNGDIFIPYTDPSIGTVPSYAKRISGVWSTGGNDVVSAHVFDFIEWGGAYYMCGSGGVAGDGAVVWKSTNSGANWSVDLWLAEGAQLSRFYTFMPYSDRLYVQESGDSNIAVANGWYTTGSGWTQETSPFWIPFNNNMFAYRNDVYAWKTRLYSSQRQKGVMIFSPSVGMYGPSGSALHRQPLDRSAEVTEPFFGSSVRSIAVDEDRNSLYMITTGSFFKMIREDARMTVLTNSQMPDRPLSIIVVGDSIYLGDMGGRVWKSNPNPPSAIPTLAENFGANTTTLTGRGFTLVDTDTQMTYTGSPVTRNLNDGAGSWGNPRFVYNTPFTRSNQLSMEFIIPHLFNSNASWYLGFTTTSTPTNFSSAAAAIGKTVGVLNRGVPGTGALSLYNAGGTETSPGREYRIEVRNTGSVMYMRGIGLNVPYDDSGINRAKWLPVAVEHLNTTTNLYAAMSIDGDTPGAFTLSSIKVYTTVLNEGTSEDTFTRADSTTTLGSTEVGSDTWTAVSGTWGISSNQAYSTTTGSTALAVVDTDESDGIVSSAVSGISGTVVAGVVFRSDGTTQNYWRAYYDGTNFKVDKIVGGSVTNVHTAADAATSGIVQVTMYEDHISVHKGAGANTVATTAITDSALQTNTQHGLYVNQAAANARFDNFLMFGPIGESEPLGSGTLDTAAQNSLWWVNNGE